MPNLKHAPVHPGCALTAQFLTICVKHLELPSCPHVRSVNQELLGQLVVVDQAVGQAHAVGAHRVAPAKVEVSCDEREWCALDQQQGTGRPGWGR